MNSVLCVPFVPVLGDKRRNRDALLHLASRIAGTHETHSAIVLPELALSGYLLESLTALAAWTLAEAQELAEALAASGIASTCEWFMGLPLREGDKVFNAAVVMREGKVIEIHRKIFLPTYGMFDEGRYFARGEGIAIYNGNLGKTGILICEDAWHLDLVSAVAELEAETVVVISASPARGYLTASEKFDSTLAWQERLRTYHASTGITFIYCNRGGVEDGIYFDANSLIVSAGEGVEGHETQAYKNSRRYMLPARTDRHAGFDGYSTRQADRRLVREIVGKALRQ